MKTKKILFVLLGNLNVSFTLSNKLWWIIFPKNIPWVLLQGFQWTIRFGNVGVQSKHRHRRNVTRYHLFPYFNFFCYYHKVCRWGMHFMDAFYNFIIIPHQFTFWLEVKSLDIKKFSENTSDCQISPERRQTLRRPRRSFVGLILENLLLITVGQWPKVRGALRWALGCRGKETWSYFAFSHISYKCLHQSKFDTKLCNFKLIS